jgi:hypothetical protein
MNARTWLSRRTLAGLFVIVNTLGACGGGGGGGGGSDSGAGSGGTPAPSVPTPPPVTAGNGFTVSINRAQLSFDSDEGGGALPQVVLGSGTGPLPAAVYTGALDLGTSIDHVTAEVIGAQVKFTIYAKADLPAGQYKGAIQLFACADAKCAQHFKGSPTDVNYTVTVRKSLKVTPQNLALNAASGAVLTRDVGVQLPDNASAYTVTSSANWINAVNVTPAGFTLNTIPLPPGTYQANITVSTAGRSRDLSVYYMVQSDASTVTQIRPDVDSLSFSATASLAAPARKVNVVLPSWTTELTPEVQYGGAEQGWLSVSKSGANQLNVTASAANLAPGNYAAQLVLKSGYLTSPVQIPVNFTVGTPTWQISGKYGFGVGGGTVAGDLVSEVTIATPNLPGQTWVASTTSSWLKLQNMTGTTGSTKLRVAVDQAMLAALPNFQVASAEVAIRSASGHLPEVNFVSPSTRLPGESGPVIVRGRGFDSLVDLPGALSVSGAAVQGVTRVNDTQFVLQLAGVSQGDTTITLKNKLSQAMGTARVQVVPARSYGYRAIKSAGVKGAILYDAARESIYVTNKTLGTLMRFAHNNGEWDISATNLATIESAQMAPDGSSIVATATSGKIALFNPDNLSLQASYTNERGSVSGYYLNSLSTMAMLNDGKAIFEGSVSTGGIPYFDLVTRTFGGLAVPNSYSYHSNEPAFNASGDGSRLLIGYPTNSALDALYYADAADGVVKLNGGGVSYWYDGAQSLHGDRMTVSSYEVRDRDFNLVGRLTLPSSNYYGRAPVFAPDAKRVYVLAYSTAEQPARVFVFDSSTKPLTTADLPMLGYFDLADYPTCHGNYDSNCNAFPLSTISPDGKTLFFAGDLNVIVAPVPGTLTMATQAASVQRARMGTQVVPAQMTLHTPRR